MYCLVGSLKAGSVHARINASSPTGGNRDKDKIIAIHKSKERPLCTVGTVFIEGKKEIMSVNSSVASFFKDFKNIHSYILV
jgi:hypothetical protein